MALNAVCEDIRQLLHDNLFGVQGTNLFSYQWGKSSSGDEVNAQILVTEQESQDSLLKDEYEVPVFSITVRGEKAGKVKDTQTLARSIYEFLLQQPRQTINGTEYVEYAPVSNPIYTGKDDNNRHSFVMTFFTYRNSI